MKKNKKTASELADVFEKNEKKTKVTSGYRLPCESIRFFCL